MALAQIYVPYLIFGERIPHSLITPPQNHFFYKIKMNTLSPPQNTNNPDIRKINRSDHGLRYVLQGEAGFDSGDIVIFWEEEREVMKWENEREAVK